MTMRKGMVLGKGCGMPSMTAGSGYRRRFYPYHWRHIPVASFLEEYDFAGKTIIPLGSHGGGCFGQSLTAIAKLAQAEERRSL